MGGSASRRPHPAGNGRDVQRLRDVFDKERTSALAQKAFGLSKGLRCPHYLEEEGGRCGIWKHRASVCATWHCKYVRGAVGARFWKSLQQLLTAVEWSLSLWCVYELDIEIEALRLLCTVKRSLKPDYLLDDLALDGKVDREVYEACWRKWLGREAEFYKEAARLVGDLDWQAVASLSGPEIKIHEPNPDFLRTKARIQ